MTRSDDAAQRPEQDDSGGAATTADEWGLQQQWLDADDEPQHVPDETIAALRELVGRPPTDLDDTAPVVTRPGHSTGLAGRLVCEDGTELDLDDVVGEEVPLGYHRLTTEAGVERSFIVSPGRCFVPEQQQWGLAVQLYAAWSRRGAGIGDLADLRTLREWAESHRAGFLMVNPLHAVAPVLPLETSPYLPATRRYRNPVYLAVDAVPGIEPFLASAGPAPEDGVIDRDAAWRWKHAVLRARWEQGLTGDDAAGHAAYRSEGGASLDLFATWCLLAAEHGADFHDWPEALRDPDGEAVAEVARERADEVGYWAWLQQLLSEQLAEASGETTVIQDLPIGVSGGGADAWVWQDVLAHGATVGAPPDQLNTTGQDWGSPPLVPWRLRAADYRPFIESVRGTIAGAGGLRIDHVMGLFRLWWIPAEAEPTAGAYVRYPADDLLDIVCLESHRAQAIVVGEDLGTVEEGVPEALAERGILSYRLLWFEDDDPAQWPELAMAAVTTHDLATVAGLWTGSDVDDQLEASDMAEDDVREGAEELLGRLRRDGLEDGEPVAAAVDAAYGQLGRAPSLLLTVALEDALEVERRPNVPGTTERDNWRVPLPVPVEQVVVDERPRRLLRALLDD